MDESEIQHVVDHFLSQAGRLRDAFPDPAAMAAAGLPAVPPVGHLSELFAALRYLHDEAAAVQAGLTDGVDVLAFEIENARRTLAAMLRGYRGDCCRHQTAAP